MLSSIAKVNLPTDAEARPVAVLVQIASGFESRVSLVSGSRKVNAKSIMGMMSLGLVNGEDITVEADGTDEETAVFSMARYIESGNVA